VKLDGKVLIAGAGIGGLTLAVALRRAGFDCELFEREPELRAVGAGILVQTSAMLALRTLGLDRPVQEGGHGVHLGYGKSEKGELLQSTSMREVAEEFGAPTVAIHRGRLQEVLREGAEGVPLHLGDKLVDFEQEDSAVTAIFASGRRERGALLVGADGLHSAVREALVGETELRYAGYTSWRGIAEVEGAFPDGEVTELWGPGARFGYAAISTSEVYWFAVLNAPSGGREAEPLEVVRRHFEHFADPVPTLLRTSRPERVFRTDIFDRAPIGRWSEGRVVLLGDAAHPTTPNLGQGGCMAIEDAVLLAHYLKTRESVAAALDAYEKKRIPPTTKIVEGSLRFGKIAQIENPVAIWFRNLMLRLTPKRVVRQQLRQNAGFSLED